MTEIEFYFIQKIRKYFDHVNLKKSNLFKK
jgi:hypothetical protein